MRRALTAALTAAVVTIGGVATVAAPAAKAARFTPVATFTLDPNGTTLPYMQVAADWSKGSNVLVKVGSCSGARCIKLTPPATLTHCTQFSGTILGCGGFTLADGSCGVEIDPLLTDYADALRYTLAHETGHCLGLGHLSDPRALMYPTTSLHPRTVSPTRLDKAALNSLYPRP